MNPPAPTSPTTNAAEAAAEKLAATSGFPYFDARDLSPVPDISQWLPYNELQTYRVAPLVIGEHHQDIEFGITAKTDHTKLAELSGKLSGHQVTFKTISEDAMGYILNVIYLRSFSTELAGDFASFETRLANSAPKEAFGLLAQLAYLLRASDIHIEPQNARARVRFRIDGTLHPITTVETDSYKVFLADLQTKANITWGSDKPQSGRISYDLVDIYAHNQSVNMRIETIPSFHGEEIVVRIFSVNADYLKLDTMGFSDRNLKTLRTIIKRTNGMVLSVGPTGSGKTSSLYAIINELNNPESKVITLEDPVEYDLPGISQIPIHSEDKELFAEKLRAVLREDPNIIMIGEIRDNDTARTALQASLTGHLVLSTFHAASTSTAISRLLDMTEENALLASSLQLINAQRLVRRVCQYCKQPVTLDSQMQKRIEQALANLPGDLQPDMKKVTLYKGKGCPKCNGLGYRDRIAIVEQMVIDQELEEIIGGEKSPTSQAIEEVAVENGMITLIQDGLFKVLNGDTTLEEIERVLDF